MGLFDLIFSLIWITLQQELTDLGCLNQVYDFFVREYGISQQSSA
jgi:hypothetical protein